MEKALFLDRDGIINVDKGYIHKKEDVEFVDGIFDLCSLAKERGYHIFVVTNQAGIDRGLYSHFHVDILHGWMKEQFRKRGVEISEMYYCPHHPEFSGPCECRKPEPGMLLKAMEEYGIDASASVMIGDKSGDVQAGKRAGVGLCILVSSRYVDDIPEEADIVADSLAGVYEILRDRL